MPQLLRGTVLRTPQPAVTPHTPNPPQPLRLAQPYAINDGRMVQLVADHCILGRQDRLKQACIGVKAGGVQDGVLGAVESGDPSF